MSLIPCPECKREMSSKAKACPHCGAPKADNRPSAWPGLLSAAVVLVILVVLISANTEPDEASREKVGARRAIELCWKDQQRKSISPEDARSVAGVCEMMEKRFRDRYVVAP